VGHSNTGNKIENIGSVFQLENRSTIAYHEIAINCSSKGPGLDSDDVSMSLDDLSLACDGKI
jgi:hypothetical protein